MPIRYNGGTQMTRRAVVLAGLILVIVTAMLAAGACSAKQPSPATTSAVSSTPATSAPATTTPAATTPAQQSVTINLVAQNMAFDTKQISVPAGAAVTVIFNNKDTGIRHNFAVYQNLSGGQNKTVFVGDIITGPATVAYRFMAPAAGNSYFFECDVHPTVMNGTFTVTP